MSFDPSALTDGELAALSLAGRDAAFSEIVRRNKEPLFRLIAHNLRDADEALDILQETLVAAYRSLTQYDQSRPMRAWLSRIAINKCRDWARRRKVRRLISFILPVDETRAVIDDARGAEDIAADRQELERVKRAIAILPTSLREPLIMHAIEGLSQAETAEALGISEKAVETRIRRARAALSSAIERQ
ncbi:MAG: RNA polymerase sigma factor [Sphingomonas sp.]|uniref:RNA polymerase sigma factor n=1 Tax=Sphingomonas sp. TaxID=28214 RepID=UPI0017E7C18C|nr:RNA polymerase sigma factor [Sphingomonas sp.]MBA3666629.1 RNA polymerase sigma factor [Sphingomonas sp.]